MSDVSYTSSWLGLSLLCNIVGLDHFDQWWCWQKTLYLRSPNHPAVKCNMISCTLKELTQLSNMQLLKNCKIFCIILVNNPLHDAWHQPNGGLKCAVIIIITADWMSPQIWRCACENHSLESQESETRETRKRRHSNSLDAKFEIINTNWNTLG